MHVCMYMCTHVNMEANEQLWVSFLRSYLLCWVRHHLSQVWSVPIHLGWLLSGFQEPTCLNLPDTRVINVYHNTHMDPRGRIQFFMLVQQALYQLNSVFNLICSPLHSLEMKRAFIGEVVLLLEDVNFKIWTISQVWKPFYIFAWHLEK